MYTSLHRLQEDRSQGGIGMKPGSHLFAKIAPLFLAVLLVMPPLASRQAVAQTVPASWECMIQPAGFLDVLAMLNDVPSAQYSNRIDSVLQSSIIEGERLSTDDATQLSWTLLQLVACGNSLDPLKVLPLLSDDFRAALLANAVYDNDLSGVIDAIPLLAQSTVEQGGVAELDILDSWYDADSNKRIWATVELPIDPNVQMTTPRFLVSLVWDTYLFVIDSIWVVE
jgi:hypothetical protein